MLDFFQWLLATWGLVYIITQSVLLHAFRVWLADRHMLLEAGIYCPACVGFWAGLAIHTLQVQQLWLHSELQALGGCALGALWSQYGPPSVWQRERGDNGATQEEEDGNTTN
jgi:hypothetical protein